MHCALSIYYRLYTVDCVGQNIAEPSWTYITHKHYADGLTLHDVVLRNAIMGPTPSENMQGGLMHICRSLRQLANCKRGNTMLTAYLPAEIWVEVSLHCDWRSLPSPTSTCVATYLLPRGDD